MTQLLRDPARGLTVIRPGVEMLDAGNSARFRKEVLHGVPTDARVLLDLSGVRFIDSSGCGAILACLRHVNARGAGPGDLKICSTAAGVRAIFEMVRLHKLVEIYNTQDDALRAFDAA